MTAGSVAAVGLTSAPASAGVVEKPLTFHCPTLSDWAWNVRASWDPDEPAEAADFGFGLQATPTPLDASRPVEAMTVEVPFTTGASVSTPFAIGGLLRVAGSHQVGEYLVVDLTAISGVNMANLTLPSLAFPARFPVGTAGRTFTLGGPTRITVVSGGVPEVCTADPANGSLFTVTVLPAGTATTTTTTTTTEPETTTTTSTTSTTSTTRSSVTRRSSTTTTRPTTTTRRSSRSPLQWLLELLRRIFAGVGGRAFPR